MNILTQNVFTEPVSLHIITVTLTREPISSHHQPFCSETFGHMLFGAITKEVPDNPRWDNHLNRGLIPTVIQSM